MRRRRETPMTVYSKVVIFTGGLKEDISQLEMEPGELIGGFNYQEEDGTVHGYQSIAGYERYDGTALASSVEATSEDDVDREDRRTAITEVPGAGPVTGVHIFDTEVYALRQDTISTTEDRMYMATSSGWTGITSADTITTGDSYEFINGRFDYLSGLQREPIFIMVNGVNAPMYYNGTSLVTITHANLPTTIFPNTLIEFKNRLFLGYPDGRVIFSAVGDPTDFDPVSGAGEIYYESPVSAFKVTPGDALAVFSDESINVVQALADVDSVNTGNELVSLYKFNSQTFSKRSGAIANTVDRILGTVIFMDDRGITSLTAADSFGDFDAKSISKSVQNGLLLKKSQITCSVIKRDVNQYRLFFDDGTGYIFTFNIDKEIKGITALRYDIPVMSASEGKAADGDDFIVFASTSGYVYLMDSGTSFDGNLISTKLETAFYPYIYPSRWKRFHKIILETTANSGLTFLGRAEFNYKSSFMPRNNQDTFEGEEVGGIWGADNWGEFIYSSTAISTPTLYVTGVGNNMNMTIVTSNKYTQPHTIQSAVVDYTILERMA